MKKQLMYLLDEVTISSTANEKVHTNESAPLDIVNLSQIHQIKPFLH